MKRLFALLLAFLLTLTCAGCATQGTPLNPAPTPDNEKPALEDIVILFTSDVHCAIDQGFGYAGLAAIRDRIAQRDYVLLVDNGDAIQGEPVGTLTRGEAILDLMNAVGYDVAIPGNHEFDYGMERFLELTEKANFPYISANFNKEGQLLLAPYKAFYCGQTKVAFVGATTPKTLTSSTPKYFQDENGNFIYGFMQDETGEKFYAAVQQAVDSARADGADYVIVLGHLGNEASAAPYTYADLIANTSGIDFLLDGHSHDTDQVSVKNKDGHEVLRMACGTKLGGIGQLVIRADGSSAYSLLQWDNELPPATMFGFTNPIQDAVTEALNTQEKKLSEVVARTDVTLTINDPEAVDAEGKPIRIIRTMETNLGDLCADAYRDQSGADVALVNGGGIRAAIGAGEVRMGDILSVHPYGNSLCVVEATGQQLLDALEWGARAVPAENGGFLQVSGLSYTIDVNVESSCTADENGLFTGVSGPRRVKDVTIGGEAIDPARTYTVASHNYMLKDSGDGFTMFRGCKLLQDEVKLDNQVLIDYITTSLNGTVGAAYADPYGDGRITIGQ